MRYGIDSLAAIIENRYHLPLFVPGTLFLFCGRRANKLKGLLWEGDGFLLFTKRIDEGRFSWPRNSSEARALSPKQFRWLMDGFPIDPQSRISLTFCTKCRNFCFSHLFPMPAWLRDALFTVLLNSIHTPPLQALFFSGYPLPVRFLTGALGLSDL